MAGLYPPTHRPHARAYKKLVGNRCEECGRPNRTLGLNKRGELTMFYLHAAHRYHDTANPAAEYVCLCPACHRAYDQAHRQALRQLDRMLRAEIARPTHRWALEEELALPARHAALLAQEQADWQAAQVAGTGQALKARALWSRCKRLHLELQIARQIVARLGQGTWQSSWGLQHLLTFYRTKRDAYLLALEAYERFVTPQPPPMPPLHSPDK